MTNYLDRGLTSKRKPEVSTISVYGYFAFALIGRQFPSQNEYREVVDMYVPIFTILQFLFYVGWLKVGEDLMFPFGADDEDFEFNYILERNLEMAFLIVDELHNQVPPVYVESLDDKVETTPEIPVMSERVCLCFGPLKAGVGHRDVACQIRFIRNHPVLILAELVQSAVYQNPPDLNKVSSDPSTHIHVNTLTPTVNAKCYGPHEPLRSVVAEQ
ncbi:hypothetical protein ANCDUO_14947 [Ancylostoma duodenale]|uniref:Bestrophin homolog n=1 Tax=Ancylostoma duodenale TaxID=51022 RepID=A0A0C2G7P0_9BILA|nr:hypothetical protein ANCDUO_14947 [Ancylostoma duodenale]